MTEIYACMESAATRLADIAEINARRIERYRIPFLCAVGIAGVVAFCRVWSMSQSMRYLGQELRTMSGPMRMMDRMMPW